MFEINVSLNGHHLFATHERSISNINTLSCVLKIFKEKFPESEGYKITACQHHNSSTILDINKY